MLHTVRREPLSSLSHFIGMLLAIAGLVLLILVAAKSGTARHITGFAIFGASVILLYAVSSLYHFLKTPALKKTFQRLDRLMIYVLIAGTYTAVALALPSRGWGWSLFGVEWGLAAVGMAMEFSGFKYKKYVSQTLYLGMGWLALIAFPAILDVFSPTAIGLLVGGGVLYTLGFVFFVLDRFVPGRPWFSMHDVFHFLVMAGSFSHFWMLLRHTL